MSTELPLDKPLTNGIRTALGISGALLLILGVLILVWPGKTAVVVAGIFAIYVIAAGLVYAGLGFFSRTRGGWSRIGHIVLGVLFVIAGVIAFANLTATAVALATFIGILVGVTWIMEGVVSLSTLRDASAKAWTVFFAAISIIAGITLIISPLWGAVVLWWIFGISAVVLGVLQIARAFTFGR